VTVRRRTMAGLFALTIAGGSWCCLTQSSQPTTPSGVPVAGGGGAAPTLTAAVPAPVSVPAGSSVNPDAPLSGTSFVNNGTNNGIMGPYGTQNIRIDALWPVVPAQDRNDLVDALRHGAHERFSVIRGFDNFSRAAAEGMFDDLKSAGWIATAPAGLDSPGTPASVASVMPAPPRPGVTVFVSAPSPSIDYLLRWCQHVGLQPGPVGVLLPADAGTIVSIEFGDPPQP
jgi:hypothetical protein